MKTSAKPVSPPSIPSSTTNDSISTFSTLSTATSTFSTASTASTICTAPAHRDDEQSTVKTTKTKNAPHHWKPKNQRQADLMAEAKREAEARHTEILAKKALRKSTKVDSRKRKRTLNKRAESSLRSAEICREKFQIYPKLLERELQREEETYLGLISKLSEMTAKTILLNQQINDAKAHIDNRHTSAAAGSIAPHSSPLSLPQPAQGAPMPYELQQQLLLQQQQQHQNPQFTRIADEPAVKDPLDDFWCEYDGGDQTDACGTDEPATPAEPGEGCTKMEDLIEDHKGGEHCSPTSILEASALGVPDLYSLPESTLAFHNESCF